ncbi:oligosaccharide flippase family protein, partial [candidate division KSB1 bacterium]|nr:oligosaccharide flippase family protein [candidate division KSB1 bacterium]
MSQLFREEFKHGIIWNYIDKLTSYSINFVLVIIIARGLGTYNFGIFTELITLFTLLWIICSLGFETTLNIFIPKYFDNPGKISYMLRSSIIIVLVFSLTIYVS